MENSRVNVEGRQSWAVEINVQITISVILLLQTPLTWKPWELPESWIEFDFLFFLIKDSTAALREGGISTPLSQPGVE